MDPKRDHQHVEDANGGMDKSPDQEEKALSTMSNADTLDARHKKEIKRIMRIVDIRVTGMLSILYMWSFIDRANLANATIAGMGEALGLTTSDRYSIVAMIFFVGYIISDLPTNWIVSKAGATLWIPTIVTCWGAITIGQGFVQSWHSLVACRILLGLCEGGLIPGAIFLIGEWYTRYEAHARLAGFYVIGICASGLSGLLAYGIEKLNGHDGLAGWRWIFLIEGVCTLGCGLLAYFVLLDLPDKAKNRSGFGLLPAFLTPEQSSLIQGRLANDHGTETAPVDWQSMIGATKDWKVWEFSLYVLLNNVALYAFAYFLPIILEDGLGYPVSKAQLFTFPPYAAASVWIMFLAIICDKLHIRGPVMIFNSVLYIIGISLVAFTTSPKTRYGGVFLGVIGITGNVPSNFAYAHNNIRGRANRAVCATLMTVGSACGGIIAGNVFIDADAPNYRPGVIIALSFQAFSICLLCKNFVLFSRWNKRLASEELATDSEKGFRFTY